MNLLFSTLIIAVIAIVVVNVILVALLLFVKIKLTPEGKVKININNGTKESRRYSCLPPAEEREAADSANVRCLKAAGQSFLLKWDSSTASR